MMSRTEAYSGIHSHYHVNFKSYVIPCSKVLRLVKLYNDVNNQQNATTVSFINLFNSTLHVSGDKFAHPQEHFLTVYTAFGTLHWSAAVSVHCTYIQSKSAPEDGRICRPKHVGLS